MENHFQKKKEFDQNDFDEALPDSDNQGNPQQQQQQRMYQQQHMMQGMQGGYPPQQQFMDPNQLAFMQQQQMMQNGQGGFPPQKMMGMPPGLQPMMQQQQLPQGVYMVNQQMGNKGLGPQMNDPNMMFLQQVAQAAPKEESDAMGFKVEASSFNMSQGEFVPMGKMTLTKEQFPTLGDDGAGSKTKKGKNRRGKKGGAVEQQKSAAKKEEDELTPYKGKPSSFFILATKEGPSGDAQNPNNFELNQEQWAFMYGNYPEYAAAPYEMMTWLHGQAQAHEDMWRKPREGGQRNPGKDDSDSDANDKIQIKGKNLQKSTK